MKRFILVLSTAAVIFAGAPGLAEASEVAHSRKFGIGGMLGQPTAFSIKYHFTPNHALTAAIGFGWWFGPHFHVHVDYGYHFDLVKPQHFDLRMYVGGGLKFFYHPWYYVDYYHDRRDWDPDRFHRAGFGVRAPVGIAFNFNKVPVEAFAELVPGIGFNLYPFFFIDAAIGARYYF